MPSCVTQYGQVQWSSMLFKLVTPPTNYYIALCSKAPGTAADGSSIAASEPQQSEYHRQQVTNDSSHWVSNSSRYITNVLPISFGIVTTNWGVINYFAICDAATGGNVYAWASAQNPQAVSAGYYYFIPPGQLSVAVQTIPSA